MGSEVGTDFLGLVWELRKGYMVAAVWTGLEEQKDPWLGQMEKYSEGEQGQPSDRCMGGGEFRAKFIKDVREVSG